MAISAYYVQAGSVMRYAAGTADRYGRPAETWAEAAAVPGRLSVVDGREERDGKEVVVSKLRWYMAAGQVSPEVTETDRIRIDGEDYEIVLVAARRVGTGAVHHLEIDLRKLD